MIAIPISISNNGFHDTNTRAAHGAEVPQVLSRMDTAERQATSEGLPKLQAVGLGGKEGKVSTAYRELLARFTLSGGEQILRES